MAQRPILDILTVIAAAAVTLALAAALIFWCLQEARRAQRPQAPGLHQDPAAGGRR